MVDFQAGVMESSCGVRTTRARTLPECALPDMRFPAHTSAFGTKVQSRRIRPFLWQAQEKVHSVPSVLSMRSPEPAHPLRRFQPECLLRRSFSVIVSCKISVVPIEKTASDLVGREQATFGGMAYYILEVEPVHLSGRREKLFEDFPKSLPPVSRTSSDPLITAFR